MALTKAVVIRTTVERREKWKRIAKREGISMADLVRDSIDYYATRGGLKPYKRAP